MVSVSLWVAELQGDFQSVGPACHKAPRQSSDCGVGCPVALCTEKLLRCLQTEVSSGEQPSWRSVAQLPLQ